MTHKRFTQKDEDDYEILDRNKHFAYAHSGYQAKKIIQELNELVETNRWLYKENNELKKENEQLKEENQALKNELNGIEQLLQSYRKTIKHDAELLADATKNGYLPPLEDWRELE